MPLYSDEAIVLRTHKLAEADRIITLLTRHHGVVRAVARACAAPRRGSAPGWSRSPTSTCSSPSAATSTRSPRPRPLAPYGATISADYDRYTAASVMLETAERLVSEERQPSVQQYLLLVGALRAMTAGEHRSNDVLDSFLLRSLSVAGYAPSFSACAGCGLEGPHRAFSPAQGGALCTTCRVPGSANPAGETLTLLGALLAGDWDVVDAAETRHRREARGLVSAYVSWHLERGLRSMPYVTEG